MKYRGQVTRIADAEAFRWYEKHSLAAAVRWFAGLDRALARLVDAPGRFPDSEEDSEALGQEVRFMLHGRGRGVYRILFAIRGEEVVVLRVRHSARGPIES